MSPEEVPRKRLSGVVLAGGASRRMGRDKALLPHGDRRLVDHVVALLQSVAEDVVVASGRRVIPGLDVQQVSDAVADVGPLGGLVAGLSQVRHDLVAVVAVDHLHADVALLAGLARRWTGQAAIIPSAAGRPQPLHAVWSRGVATDVQALLEEGVRSVLQAADLMGAEVLDDEATRQLAVDPGWATNLNTPSDLVGPDLDASRP